jgi:hypothetical protein
VNRTPRLALVLSALGVAGGCVSLTPAQKDTVADVQHFADATAATYGMMRIPVTVQPATNQVDKDGRAFVARFSGRPLLRCPA